MKNSAKISNQILKKYFFAAEKLNYYRMQNEFDTPLLETTSYEERSDI